MEIVHLKKEIGGKFIVPELTDNQIVCNDCIRLTVEDFNDFWDKGLLMAQRLTDIHRLTCRDKGHYHKTLLTKTERLAEIEKLSHPPDEMNSLLVDNPISVSLLKMIEEMLMPPKER